MDPKETQREKRNRVRRDKRLQEKKEREEREALEEEKRLKRNLASKKSMAKSRALAKMKLNTPATPPTPTAMKTPDGRSANIDTIQGSAPLTPVQRQCLERLFDKERDHERGNLNLLVRVAEKATSDISASSQRAADVAEKASGDIAAVLNSVQQYCVLTANSGTERAQYLVSTYGNNDSDDMGMLAADTSDGLFGGLARNDDEAAANKSSDCVALALFGSSGVASCPKSPTIATQSMNSSTKKESSFFGGNDTTHFSGSTGGFTFGANAAESTPAWAASLFPMAAGGAGTTFGRPFTFGTSMVMESTQTPTTSTFTGLAGGAYSGEGNEKGATFEFGATFGGPFILVQTRRRNHLQLLVLRLSLRQLVVQLLIKELRIRKHLCLARMQEWIYEDTQSIACQLKCPLRSLTPILCWLMFQSALLVQVPLLVPTKNAAVSMTVRRRRNE
mmetsp:Transcript_11622/g.21109  ORF Transcript_11622/g.21109 Transcript_11622/m.21109 type:complete len:448 (+) Transcript_11622:369-1712(+)